jgi:dihydroxy-acid dehydratase
MDKGLMGTLLRYPYEVRSADEYFDDIQDGKVTKDMLDLARHIINQKAGHFDGAINGKDHRPRDAMVQDTDVIRPYKQPLKEKAGFKVLKGNLFDSAIMKISVVSQEFCQRYLSNPKDPNAFEGRAVVFDGPEDYHNRIDDPSLKMDENTILFMRGVGPIGYPGSAEVVNMRPPAALLKRGVMSLPCKLTPYRLVDLAHVVFGSALEQPFTLILVDGLSLKGFGDRSCIEHHDPALQPVPHVFELPERRLKGELGAGFERP